MQQAAEQPRRAAKVQAYASEQSYPVVENFVLSTWGQSDPYNWLCPKVKNRNTPSGCVATATAQIMYYFRYPEQGQGKGGYTVEPSQSRQPATINGVYEWDKMLDKYYGLNLNDEQRQPIATLMRDVGYSVYMSYGASGSGAYAHDVPAALIDNFSYNPLSFRHYTREFFSTEEWLMLIAKEMKAHRPVLYGASDPKSGGHAFFFSGMDAEGKVYVNWGWDGTGNGYYAIDLLNPTGILGQSGTQHYTEHQHLVLGFKATPTAEIGEHYEAHICLDKSFTVKKYGKKLQFAVGSFYNHGYRPFNGVVGAYLVPTTDTTIEPSFFTLYDTKTASGPVSTGYMDNVITRIIDVADVPAGEYNVYIAANDELQGEYEVCRSVGGIVYYPLTKAEDGTLTLGSSILYDGVHGLSADRSTVCTSPSEYFDLQGRRLSEAPDRGTFIVKKGEKVQKVVR
jgi:hypothetical protein